MNNNINFAINNINDAVKNDSLIIFVGAGVSANSGLPTWTDLINEFKSEILIDRTENDNLRIAQYYFDTVGQYKYYQKLNNIFQNYINASTNEIHDQIFRLNPRHLITTNYDSLLETKMNSGVSKYEIIAQDSDIPYSRSEHYLIKMHGSLDNRNVVLKEEDYLDYEDNFYMISTLIKSLIMNNTVLFIGYSLNDSTFNSIFRLIQKGFSGHARKAFFYTPSPQNNTVVEYYKNKGIQVINSDGLNEDLGKNTVNFLKLIKNDPNIVPQSSSELWKKISFLNNLNYVESHDVAFFAKFGKDVMLFPDNSFNWRSKSKIHPLISNNKKVTEFLESKTSLQTFLDFERNTDPLFTQNSILAPAYKLYFEKRFSEAKVKFREIANISFDQKDYWNYLISEFNVMHIKADFPEDIPLPQSSTGNEELEKVINSLILNGNDQTKMLCTYFRDNILNFKFIYRKLYKFDDFLDKFRNERRTYRNGGFSTNNNLWTLQYNFKSLINFIEANCIAVLHYKEFLQIINRYFECLLIAYDNSNYKPNENTGETSSVLNELTLDDIKNIIPYLNKKNITTLLENYTLSKIKTSIEAKEYIFEKILSLLETMKKGHNNYIQEQMVSYINFLSFLDDIDPIKIIAILESYPVNNNNIDEIRKLLIIIINEFNFLDKDNMNKLFIIINKQLSTLILLNVNGRHRDNFPLYANILKKIKKNYKNLTISDKSLENVFYLIKVKDERLFEIEKFGKLLVNFYNLFDNELKGIVKSILKKYEKQDDSKLNINFILELVIGDIYLFKNKKNLILQHEISTIEKIENPAFQLFPNPKKVAISNLYTLIQKKYFTIDQIKSVLDITKIKDIFPEIDWTLFNVHDDETITGLLKYRTFKETREIFGKTRQDLKDLDSWLIRQAMLDKISFKEKQS